MTDTVVHTVIATPVGPLAIGACERGLTSIRFGAGEGDAVCGNAGDHRLLDMTVRQLDEYFSGSRRDFDLPLMLKGTGFQMEVWRLLMDIPYGATISYGELARRLGNPGAVRAVGLANNRNPLPIVVPCHRVIGADGSLTGYGGGLAIKEALLALEGSLKSSPQMSLFG